MTGLTVDNPGFYRDVLNISLNNQWKEAILQEYTSLIENSSFTPVINSNGMKPIGCRWVYKTKRSLNGRIRYKTCLEIKGYEQIYSVDCDKTYVPVGKLITLRYLLSFIEQNRYKIDHLDIVTGFYNPEIDTKVYMQLPEGIVWCESTAILRGNYHCFLYLDKVLYSLQQVLRLWHQEINDFLQSIGFHHSHTDISFYIQNDGVLILLYVNDILMFYGEELLEKVLEVKQQLMLQYKISNLGPAKQFLGLEIDQLTDRNITLSQSGYILTILVQFQMQDTNPGPTPLLAKNQLNIDTLDGMEVVDQAVYQSIAGSLMYSAIGTHLHIMFVVVVLSQSNMKPYRIHPTAAK